MYVLIENETNRIERVFDTAYKDSGKIEDLFPGTDPQHFTMAWCDGDQIPGHFKVDKNGKLLPLTLEEQLERNLITLQPDEKIAGSQIVKKSPREQVDEGLLILDDTKKIENNEIVTKSPQEQIDEGILTLDEPFQYLEDSTIKKRSLEEVVENGHLSTKKQCQRALAVLDETIEDEIYLIYSYGKEMKLLKAYQQWINDGKPENDEREQEYLQMQEDIDRIRKRYKSIRNKIKETRATFK